MLGEVLVCSAGKNYWAKDIVFLVTTGGEVGAQAWINSYMGDSAGGGLFQISGKNTLCILFIRLS